MVDDATGMNQEEIRLLREQALSFFGTITASLSHEINNSVAIIGELSGLLQDLLLGAEEGRAIDNDKIKDISKRITGQAKKCQEIIKRLNRFAHSTDKPQTTFDASEVLDQLVMLAQRFAFLKGVQLENKSEHESITINGSPFSLQQAVFICIRLALTASKKDETVTVAFGTEDSTAEIITTCASLPDTEQLESDLSFLSTLMKELGGTVKTTTDSNDRKSLVLTFPGSSAEQ
jgi:C4-dicarboxylate-specific signal transduction histidine kinase